MGVGVSKAKFFEVKYEPKLEMGGGGAKSKRKTSVGGVCVFSGTTNFPLLRELRIKISEKLDKAHCNKWQQTGAEGRPPNL